MSSILPSCTRQHGLSRPTVKTAALSSDLFTVEMFVCLFICVHVSNLLFTLCPNDAPRILVCWMMPVCYQLSCVCLCAFHLSQFVPSTFNCVGSLTSKHFPIRHPSLIRCNHLHQPFPVTAATLRDSIKRTLCNKQMCNCPSAITVHMQCTNLYEDSPNLSTIILCLKACKLIINFCPVNLKGLEQVSLLTEHQRSLPSTFFALRYSLIVKVERKMFQRMIVCQ
jgi:hypothetical protein